MEFSIVSICLFTCTFKNKIKSHSQSYVHSTTTPDQSQKSQKGCSSIKYRSLKRNILTCKPAAGSLHQLPQIWVSERRGAAKYLSTLYLNPTFVLTHFLTTPTYLLTSSTPTITRFSQDNTQIKQSTPVTILQMSEPSSQTVPSASALTPAPAPAPGPAATTTPAAPAPAPAAQALTPAQKKALAKAEKAARRGQVVAAKVVPPAPNTPTTKAPKKTALAAGGPTPVPAAAAQKAKGPKIPDMYSHLLTAKKLPLSKADKDVHPSVLAIGQQMASFKLKDNSARLEAMLVAFMKVSRKKKNQKKDLM